MSYVGMDRREATSSAARETVTVSFEQRGRHIPDQYWVNSGPCLLNQQQLSCLGKIQ